MHRPLGIALTLFVALGALVGASSMITDPSGVGLGLPPDTLDRSPFSTFLIPGLVLLLMVGGSQLVAALAWVRRTRTAPLLELTAGTLLLGWLVVQIALIRELHWLQGLLGTVGLAEIVHGFVALGAPAPHVADAAASAFLAHRRLGFVGLSARDGEFSVAVARELRARGHEVVPINPRAAAAGANGFHASLRDLSDPPRAALLMVPRTQATAAVDDCIAAGVQAVWFHRGAGPGSATPEAVARARDAGLAVVTNACPLMFLEGAGWGHRAHRRLSAGT